MKDDRNTLWAYVYGLSGIVKNIEFNFLHDSITGEIQKTKNASIDMYVGDDETFASFKQVPVKDISFTWKSDKDW